MPLYIVITGSVSDASQSLKAQLMKRDKKRRKTSYHNTSHGGVLIAQPRGSVTVIQQPSASHEGGYIATVIYEE